MKSQSDTHAAILIFSLPLAGLVTLTGLVGLLTPEFYWRESLNWQAQSVGQDIVNLFLVVPALVVTSILAYRGNAKMKLLWGGVLLYLIYTFVIYCFSLHFNSLFIVYCLILGLSFYAFIYFVFSAIAEPWKEGISTTTPLKVVGIYFIVLSCFFYFLWLAEVIPPSLNGTIPKGLEDAGLAINPVHILDLSVILPGIFIAGVLLLNGHSLGVMFAPVILVFFIVMDATLAVLTIVMHRRGVEEEVTLAFIMTGLAMASLSLLMWYVKALKNGHEKNIIKKKMQIIT